MKKLANKKWKAVLKKGIAFAMVAAVLISTPTTAKGFSSAASGTNELSEKGTEKYSVKKDSDGLLKASKKPSVSYKAYIQDKGWLPYVKDAELGGTTGESKRLEALRIKINTGKRKGGITYRSYVQKYGWRDWVSNGKFTGVPKKAKRLEAIQIKLTGEIADYYDVYYRVHCQKYGWLGWAKNGKTAGTIGYDYRAEAIQIVLVKKGGKAPGKLTETSYTKGNIKYCSHVQGSGWQDYVSDGKGSGTLGKAKRMEAIKISLTQNEYQGGVRYRTYVESKGWMGWRKDGRLAGTTKQGKRMEAIRIKLAGEVSEYYDIYYRVHLQTYGWMKWRKNGQLSGSTKKGKRIEAIQVFMVPKGDKIVYPDPDMQTGRNIDPSKPMVALTYDDGPYAPVTSRILDSLDSVGGAATFFVVGNRVSANASVVKRASDMGCQIANHTWDHTALTSLSSSGMISQINGCNNAIASITGQKATVVRPVGGSVNANVTATLNYPLILWSIDTLDWKTQSSSSTYSAVMNNVKDGDIVLMHDLYGPTASASEQMIPELAKRGYQLVTIDELAYYKGINLSGHTTYSAIR